MTPLRLKDDAVAQLVARDELLRHPDGKPHHNLIINASGISVNQWWKIRRGEQNPGAKSVPRLITLAMRTGLTEQEAYALLFTTEPRETAPLAA